MWYEMVYRDANLIHQLFLEVLERVITLFICRSSVSKLLQEYNID